jgi:hypothetical protein
MIVVRRSIVRNHPISPLKRSTSRWGKFSKTGSGGERRRAERRNVVKKVFVIFAVILVAGGFLAADDGWLTPEEIASMSAPSTPPEGWLPPAGASGSPEWYGTDGRFWVIGSASGNCSPTSSDEQWGQNWGWYYGTDGFITYWDCTLQAPTGILIKGFEVEYDDTDASDNVCATFMKSPYYSASPTTIAEGCSSGSGGTGGIYITGLDETISNHWNVYLIRVVTNSGTSSNKFRTVAYSAYRQISPAPGSATFPDVGTGFWAFQAIEALAASGITTGFPDGTFRPLEPVTRAQMAAFLARALGLHWNDS